MPATPTIIDDVISGTMIILRAFRKIVPMYSKIVMYLMPMIVGSTPVSAWALKTKPPMSAAMMMAIKICQCSSSLGIAPP